MKGQDFSLFRLYHIMACVQCIDAVCYYRCCVSITTMTCSQLNQLTCSLGCDSAGPKERGRWGPDPPGEGAILGASSSPLWSMGNILHEPKLLTRWQQWCGLLLSVVQQLVRPWWFTDLFWYLKMLALMLSSMSWCGWTSTVVTRWQILLLLFVFISTGVYV